MPDPRFKSTGFLLMKKQITYKGMFKHLPQTVIAVHLKITGARMQRIRNNPGNWNLFEIYALAELLGIPARTLFNLIDESI